MNTACTQIALVPISPARRWLALLSGMLTAMLYFTTIMVVTSIMPQIQGAMAATADEVSWVVTFNLLAKLPRDTPRVRAQLRLTTCEGCRCLVEHGDASVGIGRIDRSRKRIEDLAQATLAVRSVI